MLARHLDLLTFLTLINSIHKMFSIDFTSLKCTHYVYALKRFTKTNKYIEVSVFINWAQLWNQQQQQNIDQQLQKHAELFQHVWVANGQTQRLGYIFRPNVCVFDHISMPQTRMETTQHLKSAQKCNENSCFGHEAAKLS